MLKYNERSLLGLYEGKITNLYNFVPSNLNGRFRNLDGNLYYFGEHNFYVYKISGYVTRYYIDFLIY